jgi:hypothetical protein
MARAAALSAIGLVALAAPLAARAESGRWGSFEIAAGTYRPDIDSEFASPLAYEPFSTGARLTFRWTWRASSSTAWARLG